ncbi:MAG: hypothetical protein AB7M12_06910 [Hyphomonadaceae bacterium]
MEGQDQTTEETPEERRRRRRREANARWRAKPSNREAQARRKFARREKDRQARIEWLSNPENREKERKRKARCYVNGEGRRKGREARARWLAASPVNVEKARNANKRWLSNPENAEKSRRRQAVWRREQLDAYLLSQTRNRAARSGLAFAISRDEIAALIAPMNCSVTNIRLGWQGPQTVPNPWAPSLDRIDGDIGYLPGNVRVVCWAFNVARNSWTDDVVSYWCRSFMAFAKGFAPLDEPWPFEAPTSERQVSKQWRWEQRHQARHRWRLSRQRASAKGLLFDLAVEDVEWMLEPMRCQFSGVPLRWSGTPGPGGDPFAASLDQIIPGAGYTRANARIVAHCVNSAKNVWADDVLVTLAEALSAQKPGPKCAERDRMRSSIFCA